ncbi:MAG: RDD family protein [Kaiparowitsia implicata GSE-PSE-MK54-09C]|jgi:uncharacterized RDD family membrane protein YckC|nr:RDD family protein [Kaiparowitsia implicata GSE-PSE-MK54-09C]
MHFFNRVTLPTPESTELEFALAGLGNRALAIVIDYVLLAIALTTFWTVWLIASVQVITYAGQIDPRYGSLASTWLLAIALLLSFILSTGYFIWFEVMRRGQTPGKRWVNIRVVKADGTPVGIAQAVLRSLLRPIDDAAFIGLLLILLTPREQRLGDLLAGTLVVQEASAVAVNPIYISTQAHALAAEWAAQGHSATLTADDLAVVRAYLQRRSQLTATSRSHISATLTQRVGDRLPLDNLPPNLSPDDVLEAVYQAWGDRAWNDDAII